ncbi:MAG: HD domain-containing protein [Butyrivibrio sp.]|nr:HD domain-containing protein [Butyrivibrio sp.]
MFPTRTEAEELLLDAERSNPGKWADHCRITAHCAESIAKYSGMDSDKAYVLGLLHDIGRKFGIFQLRHVSEGYKYMISLGYGDAARICLTHSFDKDNVDSYVGKFDAPEEDIALIREKLKEAEQDDYDKLIQLCDAIAGTDEVMDIIDRMEDVRSRYGSYDPGMWQTNLELKAYFEEKMGKDLYEAVKETVNEKENLERNSG